MCEDACVRAEIVRLADPQIPAAAATLARAFHDDPLMIYAVPDAAERTRLLPDVYARMIRFGVLTGEVYVTAGTLEGVALCAFVAASHAQPNATSVASSASSDP